MEKKYTVINKEHGLLVVECDEGEFGETHTVYIPGGGSATFGKKPGKEDLEALNALVNAAKKLKIIK